MTPGPGGGDVLAQAFEAQRPRLDPEVIWRGDGGGKVTSGRGAQGAQQVARALVLLTRRPPAGWGPPPSTARRAWWWSTPAACCRSSRSPWTAAGSPPSMWSATRTSPVASGSLAKFARWPGWARVLGRASHRWQRPAHLVGGHADVAQLVEHHLAKVRVAGSNPVVRSEVPDAVLRGRRSTRLPGECRLPAMGPERRSGRVA